MASKPFPFSVCKECCSSGGGGTVVDTDALKYKGSVKNTSSLPSNPSIGDMYNIEIESTITKKETKTLHLIPVSGIIGNADFTGTYDASSYDYWWEGRESVELFDSKGNSLGVADCYPLGNGVIATYQTDFLELTTDVAYAQLPGTQDGVTAPGDVVTVYETIEIPIMTNQKVFYNGTEWDVFNGDMSAFATKEEIGDIKTALDYIKELQNSYIGGDGV